MAALRRHEPLLNSLTGTRNGCPGAIIDGCMRNAVYADWNRTVEFHRWRLEGYGMTKEVLAAAAVEAI